MVAILRLQALANRRKRPINLFVSKTAEAPSNTVLALCGRRGSISSTRSRTKGGCFFPEFLFLTLTTTWSRRHNKSAPTPGLWGGSISCRRHKARNKCPPWTAINRMNVLYFSAGCSRGINHPRDS
jgi:hypothetical protein